MRGSLYTTPWEVGASYFPTRTTGNAAEPVGWLKGDNRRGNRPGEELSPSTTYPFYRPPLCFRLLGLGNWTEENREATIAIATEPLPSPRRHSTQARPPPDHNNLSP